MNLGKQCSPLQTVSKSSDGNLTSENWVHDARINHLGKTNAENSEKHAKIPYSEKDWKSFRIYNLERHPCSIYIIVFL